jgi:hypothetical protein
MEINATLIDFKRVYESIDCLSDIEKDKVIRQGLRAANNLFIKAGKEKLQSRLKGTGQGGLMKAFVNRIKKKSLGALAGFNKDVESKKAKGVGFHAHLLDRGTKRRTTEKGKDTGVMPANNFWTDAINQNKGQALEQVYKGIERGITTILKRN